MTLSILWKLFILLLSLVGTGSGENGSKFKFQLKRSYQPVSPLAVVNDAQGLQYYAAGPLYTAIPTVLIPNQIGLAATPVANVVLPPSSEPKPSQEFLESSTPAYGNHKPSRIPAQAYKHKHRASAYVPTGKRPASYINSVYGHPVRMKPLSSIPPKKPKVSSLTIQPSIDLSGQFNQEAASSLYPSTSGPPVVSTYGPAKAVDFMHKTRLSGIGGQTVYHRLKGASHRHSFYPPKKMRVYSHVHKDHIHNHYIPASHSLPAHKTQQTIKYAAPGYLPPVPSTPPTHSQKDPPHYAYQTGTRVRFPEDSDVVQSSATKDQTDFHESNTAPGDVTQAIIKNPGVINNYDAAIPIHVPSKKPYRFEVNEILKNSDLHFVQEAQGNANVESADHQHVGLVQYEQKVPYQNGLLFDAHAQPLYAPMGVDQMNVLAASGPLDIYSFPGLNAHQTNHVAPDQDLGTSETVKIPVAIIRGTHNFAAPGIMGFTMKRKDETAAEEEVKKNFTPSKRTSDWIPMSGNGVPLIGNDEEPEKSSQISSGTPNKEDHFSSHLPEKDSKAVRHQVGDIISAKIPQEFSPKDFKTDGGMVSGKIPFVRNPDRDKRKGSVIDVSPSSGSDISKIGDTSDLVVSSVIKFS